MDLMRPVRASGWLHLSPSQAGDKRDDISAYALGIGERPVYPPACVSSDLGPGIRWRGVFQVVKTTQSRGRTERTLLKHFRDYSGPIKVARCGFPLGENHE
jgi:hypothetical protein